MSWLFKTRSVDRSVESKNTLITNAAPTINVSSKIVLNLKLL